MDTEESTKVDVGARVEQYKEEQFKEIQKVAKFEGLSEQQAEECNKLFTRFYKQKLSEGIELDWSKIEPLPSEYILNVDKDKSTFTDSEIVSFLNKLVVLKLNGGIGTSMGCSYPKSCIRIKDDLTFLHMIFKQVDSINKKYGTNIPVVLMNSRRTEEITKDETKKALEDLGISLDVQFFNQPVYPRADVDTLLPTKAISPSNPEYWYPPGHASVLTSFIESGLAASFAEQGKEWVFISNSDNLGAVPDANMLGKIIHRYETNKLADGSRYSFFMEATKKTPLDVKGGTPILYNGTPFLLEASQVPKGRENDIFDIKRFTMFNTANLWINLKAWLAEKSFDLPIIYNPKVIDGDEGKASIVQLEMGVGAALSHFSSIIINVPRHRFIPVKLTCDLLRLQSDLFVFHDDGIVEPVVEEAPIVVLSKEFAHVYEYNERVEGSVSLKEATRVVLDGNIMIKGGVSFVGDVEVHHADVEPLVLTGEVKGK